jgi:hypothetical protein
MVEERHRLNAVVYRRTKADACTPDGVPLFTRRGVHTESFVMAPAETAFYAKLREYLLDGFDLAKQQGNQGRALGFVMTIFQKIAASSFAAVRGTLRRRQLALTLHEAILKDQALDIDGHQALIDAARNLIHEQTGLPDDPLGRGEVERILADLKLRLMRRLDEEQLASASPSGIGAVAKGGLEQPVTLSVWWVQSFGGGSGTGAYIIPIAVDPEGKRVPAIEKRYRDVFRTPAAHPVFQPSERIELMHRHIEPTLQRELSYRGIASPEKGCSSELVAWVEIR